MMHDMKLFHVRLHKTLKYIVLKTKFEYFDMNVCRQVSKLAEKFLTSHISNLYINNMELCNVKIAKF
jgi:hemerythrin